MISRRRLLAGAGALASAAPLGLPSVARLAQPITLLVGGAAGSSPDNVARAFAPFLQRHLPFTDIEIRNLPSGLGLDALQAVAAAPPTGTVLGWVSTPVLSARIVDRGAAALLPRLALLGAVQKEPIAFVSPAGSPLTSVSDLLKRTADDGAPLATPPAGSPPHLAALRLRVVTGARLNLLEFPTATAAREAAVAGNAAAAALGLSDAIGDLREGRLVGLGLAAAQRADAFPDLSPLRDSGIDLTAVIRRGLAAPAHLPGEIAARLVTALQDVVADPEFLDAGNAAGFVVSWMDGAAWTARVEVERAELGKLWGSDRWQPSGTG